MLKATVHKTKVNEKFSISELTPGLYIYEGDIYVVWGIPHRVDIGNERQKQNLVALNMFVILDNGKITNVNANASIWNTQDKCFERYYGDITITGS